MELQTSGRRSPRIQGYDYSSAGAYFVTICTHHRRNILGSVDCGSVKLTSAGKIAEETWLWLAEKYPYVGLDEWVLMPNHLHGIIVLDDGSPKPLGRIVGAYKAVSSKRIIGSSSSGDQVWQRSFYEHIIRDEKSLMEIRQYIRDNPAQWAVDRENLDNYNCVVQPV